MPAVQSEQLLTVLKRVAALLRDGGVPFALGGGLAAWARGGPPSEKDVDLLLREEDCGRALELLADAGYRTETPPEGWLVKAFDDHLDFGPPLEVARALREQISWPEIRRRTADSPFARTFFVLLHELSIVPFDAEAS